MLKRSTAFIFVAVCVLCVCVGPASAQTHAPGWELTARTFPTNLPPEGKGTIELDIVNVGEASSIGPITVTDTLPEGVTATNAGELKGVKVEESSIQHELWNCAGNGTGGSVEGATVVTCTNEPSGFVFAGGGGGPSEDKAANRNNPGKRHPEAEGKIEQRTGVHGVPGGLGGMTLLAIDSSSASNS